MKTVTLFTKFILVILQEMQLMKSFHIKFNKREGEGGRGG